MADSGFLHNKSNKLLRLRLEDLANEEHFGFVRSRIRVVRLFRHLLKERHDQFSGMPTFAPLLRSIESLDRVLEECELLLRRYAVGEISAGDLDALIQDDVVEGLNDLEGPGGCDEDSQSSQDAEMLMDRVWDSLMPCVRSLQDALKSVWDQHDFATPDWRIRFERNESEFLNK